MEDDDEFGELYTDVLRPVSFPVPPPPSLPPPSSSALPPGGRRPDPLLRAEVASGAGDGDAGLFGRGPPAEPPSTSDRALAPAAAEDGGGEDNWMLGRAAPAVEPTENWDEEEDDAVSSRPGVVVSSPRVPGEGEARVLEDEEEEEEARVSEIPEGDGGGGKTKRVGVPEEDGHFGGGGVGENSDNLGEALLIPGLSAEPAPSGPFLSMNNEEGKPPQTAEDWDSDSEDDLQIVLNDNHSSLGANRNNIIEMNDDDDDDGEEDLVIVTDQDQHRHLPVTEEQDWTEETIQPTVDGEKKESVDAAKVISNSATAPGVRVGYSNHGFHAQHHSMYKYVRPGVAPVPGDPASGTVGLPGPARPPTGAGPVVGQGRGDWRPIGGRGIPGAPKNYHTNFGFPAWANNSARGLDFTLPPHKTVFDVDLESFEEKPWRHPGVDISDFFNFGLDEDRWKDYCKRLDQLRLESTMQSKIRVYESGRSEQEYDPDLPPELAAASGHDMGANNGHGKIDDGETNIGGQGRGSAVMRAPLPTGRAIQVEGGSYCERLPSIDTRPPRIRDSDAIIEIVLQDSFDDSKMHAPEQLDTDVKRPDSRSFHEVEKVDRNNSSEFMNHLSHTSSNRNKEISRLSPFAKDKYEVLPCKSGSFAEPHQNSRIRSPVSHDGELEIHPVGRSRTSSAREQSTDSIPSRSGGDQQKETLLDSTEVDQNSQKSPAVADYTARELSVEEQGGGNEEKLAVADSMEGEDMTSDLHASSDTDGDDNLDHPGNMKQKLSSHVEQTAAHDTGCENELRTSNSDNSREKSGSSKDYPRRSGNGEVIQEGQLNQSGHSKRLQKEDERNVRRKDDYHMDDKQERDKSQIVARGREDVSNSNQNLNRARSYERRKESESSNSSWQRREDNNVHGKRTKDEEMWENNDEMLSRHKSKRAIDRNQKDEDQSRKHVDGDWRGHNRDEGSRQRERNDAMLRSRDNKDDPALQRKRDDEYPRGKSEKVDTSHGHRDREDSGRRKRERDDGLHHKRRELDTRMRDKAEDHLSSKHKDDSWRHRERDDRQRLKPQETAPTHREREEGRGTGRSGRITEDKPSGGSRTRDEPKAFSYEKDYQEKERRRPNEFSRRDRVREDNVAQNKGRGDASANEKHSNANERSSRHERPNTHSDRHPTADGQQTYKERQRDTTSKAKDAHHQNNQGLGKRKHDDRHQSEKAYNKDANKQDNINTSSTTLSKKDPHHIREPHEVRKQGEDDPASDDENQSSRRGRSKLERWTSHKERDYDAISNPLSAASAKENKSEGNAANVGGPADDSTKIETNNIAGEVDAKDADGGQISEKMVDDQDRHLDTVAKLKRRSERFKLPMPRDKEMALSKKSENEAQVSNNEAGLDSDIKPERPARKRRWTGS